MQMSSSADVNYRKIAITLKIRQKGEEKAQSCDNPITGIEVARLKEWQFPFSGVSYEELCIRRNCGGCNRCGVLQALPD